ncbi:MULTISPECIES: hypothetical protein [Planktothricoides]|uniref:Uncharacterized protein n=2 Tax=Planktothricoides raciborskii TaxID=132608 RepID=A0AAU8JIC8_9CYAN|nr:MULTISPECIES: hypothetical protein [Planktothricoides]MBD2543657.1 hypothetical protein [Planktothricoides raciborskii FACHB-1370]MBD2582451.1 hypothetical protein [Planktothricoides raciborskii FACHB-1261]
MKFSVKASIAHLSQKSDRLSPKKTIAQFSLKKRYRFSSSVSSVSLW